MIIPEFEALLDVMGVGHHVNCFDNDITFIKSHFGTQDIHIVHVCGEMHIRTHVQTAGHADAQASPHSCIGLRTSS